MAVKPLLLKMQIEDVIVPVLLYEEYRANARVSFGKDAVHLRIPSRMPKHLKQGQIDWAKNWLLSQKSNKPQLFHRFREKHYYQGQIIETYLKQYQLQIHRKNQKRVSSKVYRNQLIVHLPDSSSRYLDAEDFKKILSRSIGRDLHTDFESHVFMINQKYFREDIGSVKLKYLSSRWGSCSDSRNLNFSTRLLLAPREVVEYVIVHELAHLKEMNHGPRFWAWVAKADPDYKSKERWLKKKGNELDF